ncbi:MAG: exodeoxyribonuclease III [Parasporobacterium sp.]|nr:exodeoxyribonuclease III [Parasporobacterium sp.]
MKCISWNVNGIRACMGKGFMDFFNEADADFFCLQETKMQAGQLELDLPGYHQFWNFAEKKGYSGTAIFTRREPLKAANGMGVEEHDMEGRVITLEYEDFYFITVYVPNSQDELKRLDYRMDWEDTFRKYVNGLEAGTSSPGAISEASGKGKPVIYCGDLNVAHKEIDLKNPKTNHHSAGFTDEERAKFDIVVKSGLTDTFRYFYPDMEEVYSWWSYRFKSRERNTGWRIDYFVTSESLNDRLKDAKILSEVLGSDHCPVELDIEL